MKTRDILQQAGIQTEQTIPDDTLINLNRVYESSANVQNSLSSIGKILSVLLEKDLTKEMKNWLQILDEHQRTAENNNAVTQDRVRILRIHHLKARETHVHMVPLEVKS